MNPPLTRSDSGEWMPPQVKPHWDKWRKKTLSQPPVGSQPSQCSATIPQQWPCPAGQPPATPFKPQEGVHPICGECLSDGEPLYQLVLCFGGFLMAHSNSLRRKSVTKTLKPQKRHIFTPWGTTGQVQWEPALKIPGGWDKGRGGCKEKRKAGGGGCCVLGVVSKRSKVVTSNHLVSSPFFHWVCFPNYHQN